MRLIESENPIDLGRVREIVKVMRCFLIFAALGTAFAADPLADVFARMDKSSQQFKGMTANIKDDVFVAVANDHDGHTGTIKFRRLKPNDTRVLIDFTAPNAQTVSLEGTQGKVYYPSIHEIQVYDISGKRGLIDQFLLLGFGASSADIKSEYEASFAGTETIDGQAAAHIKLIPKSTEVLKQLKEAHLWISNSLGLPVQQKFITSASGDYRLATYSNMKINPSLSDKDLRLNPPKGVQIKQVGK